MLYGAGWLGISYQVLDSDPYADVSLRDVMLHGYGNLGLTAGTISLAMVATLEYCRRNGTEIKPTEVNTRIVGGVAGVAAIASIGKELADHYSTNRFFSLQDLTFDAIGIGFGITAARIKRAGQKISRWWNI